MTFCVVFCKRLQKTINVKIHTKSIDVNFSIMVDWRKLAFQMLCRFINHGTLIKLLKRIGGNGKRKLVYEEFNQAFVLLVIPFFYFFFFCEAEQKWKMVLNCTFSCLSATTEYRCLANNFRMIWFHGRTCPDNTILFLCVFFVSLCCFQWKSLAKVHYFYFFGCFQRFMSHWILHFLENIIFH